MTIESKFASILLSMAFTNKNISINQLCGNCRIIMGAMGDEYVRKMAQLVVAQMLCNKGIEGVQHSALEVLEDLLIRYINDLGRHVHSNAEIARRTSCNPLDVVRVLVVFARQSFGDYQY